MSDLLPRWCARLDAFRTKEDLDYSDLLSIVSIHFRVLESAEKFLGPYNAKQRSNNIYMAPTKDLLKQMVKQQGMNDLTYNSFINSLIKFCEQYKGNRALPTPHPSSIHSIQLASPAFNLQQGDEGVIMVFLAGNEKPLLVKGLKNPEQMKFIIVRPKLSKLGTPSVSRWEILFFKHNPGYIVDWYDSMLNPRYSGILGR